MNELEKLTMKFAIDEMIVSTLLRVTQKYSVLIKWILDNSSADDASVKYLTKEIQDIATMMSIVSQYESRKGTL